jgi:RHS repeat-associated protein
VGGYGVRKLNDTLDTMGVRQYSEVTGRFTAQDPLKRIHAAVNFYRYAANNPFVFIDPFGLSDCPCKDYDKIKGSIPKEMLAVVIALMIIEGTVEDGSGGLATPLLVLINEYSAYIVGFDWVLAIHEIANAWMACQEWKWSNHPTSNNNEN